MKKISNYKDTEELIQELVKDLKPTKIKSWKLPCLIWCMVISGIIAFNYSFLSDMFTYKKEPIDNILMDPIFLMGFITSIFAFLYSIFAALPGRNYQIWKYLSYSFFFLWGLWILWKMFTNKQYEFPVQEFYHCGTGTIITAIILFAIVYYFIKKRYILDLESAILGGILAASSSGSICLGFVCQNPNPPHLFYTHYLPILLIFLIIYFIFYLKNNYF